MGGEGRGGARSGSLAGGGEAGGGSKRLHGRAISAAVVAFGQKGKTLRAVTVPPFPRGLPAQRLRGVPSPGVSRACDGVLAKEGRPRLPGGSRRRADENRAHASGEDAPEAAMALLRAPRVFLRRKFLHIADDGLVAVCVGAKRHWFPKEA